MLKTSAYILVATILSLGFVGAMPADAAETARKGLVRCGANNFLRMAGAEVQTTSLTLRNFDTAQPITITRLRVYNALGSVIYDSAASLLPVFSNGLLGPGDNTLNPHQTSSVFFDSFLSFLPQTDRPLQLIVEWSSVNAAVPLHVGSTTVVRERDLFTGFHLVERSRTGGSCESILLR